MTATATSPTAPEPAPALDSPWIVGRRFDLVWFFGGGLLSFLALALFGLGVPTAAIFWAWTLLVDGPHIAATLVRTYPDAEERRTRRRLLILSAVIATLTGPLFLLAEALGAKGAFDLFLGAVALYAYHHVVRQHYGFLALYRAKGGERSGARLDKACLYLGCWAPYLVLLIAHPSARPLLGLPAEMDLLSKIGAGLGLAVFLGALLAFLVSHRPGNRPKATRVKVAYVGLILPLYGLCYLVFAQLEPSHPNPTTPDQAFLLITVMISIVHGVQYVGLVWFHNRNRYSREGVSFGAARHMKRFGAYAGALLLFSGTLYLASAAAAGVFPWLAPWAKTTLGPVTANQIGLCVWWGLALHHYLVDQEIWRIKGDPDLAANLGLRPYTPPGADPQGSAPAHAPDDSSSSPASPLA